MILLVKMCAPIEIKSCEAVLYMRCFSVSILDHCQQSSHKSKDESSGMLINGEFPTNLTVFCDRKALERWMCFFTVTNICPMTMRWWELCVFLCVCLSVLNVCHWETVQAAFAVRDWRREEDQQHPAVYTPGQWLHMEEKCFSTPGQITFNIHFLPLTVFWNHWWATPGFPQSVSIFLALSIHTSSPVSPFSLPFSLPSAQSHHTGSLFLANLSLIHYWDLFFFLESQNEEGERIFWIFNAPHEKCSISHFSTIWTGKLLAGHNTPSHEMMWDKGRKALWWTRRCREGHGWRSKVDEGILEWNVTVWWQGEVLFEQSSQKYMHTWLGTNQYKKERGTQRQSETEW